MLVARFDMEPVDGEWRRPSTGKTNLANVMSQPDHDVMVNVRVREEYEEGEWVVDAKGGRGVLGVTVEDLDSDRDGGEKVEKM